MRERIQRARGLRREATDAERLLWNALRDLRQTGLHFRRQVPMGPYFADFACHRRKLIIEVDGATHSTDAELDHDARRTRFLKGAGYRVVRFSNDDVFHQLDMVVLEILRELGEA